MEENKQNKNFAGIYRDEINKFSGLLRLFLIHLIISCNHSDNPGFIFDNKPFPLKRGQFVTSTRKLAEDTGLTHQSTRTFLKNLENLKILTHQSTHLLTNRATLITFTDIDKFLVSPKELTYQLAQQLTNDQHTPNTPLTHQLTTNNNDNTNNDTNNDNNKKINKRFQKPTIEEIEQYCKERGNSINPLKFYNYYESNGWKVGKNPMKNWKAAIITWEGNGYSQKGKMSIDVI